MENRKRITIFIALVCCSTGVYCQQSQNNEALIQASFPYYMQSPLITGVEIIASNLTSNNSSEVVEHEQRSIPNARPGFRKAKGRTSEFGRSAGTVLGIEGPNKTILVEPIPTQANTCLYDKGYFAKLDECLSRKPYPTVGLPAFKNDDLLIKRGLSEKQGCVFVLNNGLFKSFQINRYAIDSDSKCLDGNKVGISMALSNVTQSYLWTLRCLNRADQLLNDATLDGKTTLTRDEQNPQGICVGASQSFGFTSLQLSNIEAQMDLSMDIFKNWRVTNVTVAMTNPTLLSIARSTSESETGEIPQPTSIREFVFESLDGDELNWRYLQLFQNWSRNRMHTNFLDQFKRFLWISLQRCLSESSDHLPTKLTDVFANQKYI